MRTSVSLRRPRDIVGILLGLGIVACSKDQMTPQGPITVQAKADPATSESTDIKSYSATADGGVVTLDAKDANGDKLVTFRVTKLPGVRYWDENVPSMVVVMDGTAPSGAQIHVETMSVYLRSTDLTRTEFELYGVGDRNLVVRWAYNPDGIPQRMSLLSFRGTGDASTPRLRQMLSNTITRASIDTNPMPPATSAGADVVDTWATAQGIEGVIGSPLFDIAYFIQRDGKFTHAIMDAIDPNDDALVPTNSRVRLTSSGIHILSTDDTDDTDDPNDPDNPDKPDDPDDPADDDAGPDPGGDDAGPDDDECDGDDPPAYCDDPDDEDAGGHGQPRPMKMMMPKGGGGGGGMMMPMMPKMAAPKMDASAGKPGQMGGCDPSTIKGFLDDLAKDPTGIGLGLNSCKSCLGMSATPPPATTSMPAAAATPSKAYQHLKAGGKLMIPATLGNGATCGACAKFLQKPGTSHALSCILGSGVDAGALKGASIKPLGLRTPLPEYAGVPIANSCVTGIRRCAYNSVDKDKTIGSADLCSAGPNGAQVCTTLAP